MKIQFVSHGGELLASHRMRVVKFVDLLKARGHDATWSDKIDIKADVNVFSKAFNTMYDSQMLGLLKDHNKKTAYDICDIHPSSANIWAHEKFMIERADIVIANGPNIISILEKHTGRGDIKYVKDPITFPSYPVNVNLTNPKILWFGHKSNLGPLFTLLARLPDNQKITIITNGTLPEEYLSENVEVIPWGLGVVEEQIKNYDIVIIPLKEDESKRYKSTDRAVEALHAGRCVITDADNYLELQPFIWVGDIIEGIRYYKNPVMHSRVLEATRLGQEYVTDVYSDIKISDQLELAFTGIDPSIGRDG